MKGFLAVLIAGGLGIFFYHQKHQETAARPQAATAVASPNPAPASAAAQPRPVSEHNWMKRSLDRATEVRDQSRAQTSQSQNP